jgi:hypothetical protein
MRTLGAEKTRIANFIMPLIGGSASTIGKRYRQRCSFD